MVFVWASVLLLLLPAVALAAPISGGDTRPPDDAITLQDPMNAGLNPVMKGETRITGTVMDRDRRPLSGIQVKLFVDGVVQRSVTTDAVGQYDFKQLISYSGKETIAMWFCDPTSQLTPKALILAESETCRDANLLSPCYSRIQFEPVVESKVYMFDKKTRMQQVFAAGCL
jgi:hypothetical protein